MPQIPMVADQAVLDVNDIAVAFSSPDEAATEAIRRVSLSLQPGKTLCVVGESGCGKSVTARAVLGLLDRHASITRGSIMFRSPGEESVDLARLGPTSRRMRAVRGKQIAMIFQEPMSSLSPVHTIGDQIDEMIIHHERVDPRAARRRTIELLDRVGIPGARQRADSYPFQLSGGLNQRAMIAMALSCSPQVLIADEPTTALDVTTQAQILRLLRDVQAEFGMAMMFITHDLGVVAQIADTVAVMYLGDLVEAGSVTDIFARPAHPYTKALLQSVPKLARGKDRVRLNPIAGTVPTPRARPAGCAFFGRCPVAIEPCATIIPAATQLGDGHLAHCHLLSQTSEALA